MKKLTLTLLLAVLPLLGARDVDSTIQGMFNKERYLFKFNYALIDVSDGTECFAVPFYGGYQTEPCTNPWKVHYWTTRDIVITKVRAYRKVQATVEGDCKFVLKDYDDTVLSEFEVSNRPYGTYDDITLSPSVRLNAPADGGSVEGADGLKVAIENGTTGTCQSTGQVVWMQLYFYGYYVEDPVTR